MPSATLADALPAAKVEQAQTFAGDSKQIDPAVIKLQVLLDRSQFSPGVIDGREGENVDKAISAYETAARLPGNGHPTEELLRVLASADRGPVLQHYTISADDVKGPFLKTVPDSLEEMAKLSHLSYISPRELLAEKFHLDEDLLVALNPGANFAKVGAEIIVPMVKQRRQSQAVTNIIVDTAGGSLSAFDALGQLVAFYPASVGSEGKPSPTGTHLVQAIAPRPKYYYNPKELNFSGVNAKGLLEIAAGPNNPVGTVWIDLTEPTYGIHGTPEPSLIGKSRSHGCVRLTNWDAEELASMVSKGTVVTFR